MEADTSECEALILSGACDGFLPDEDPRFVRPHLLWELRLRSKGAHRSRPEASLFDLTQSESNRVGSWSHIDRWMHERNVLGFGLGQHPLDLYDFSALDWIDRCAVAKLDQHVNERIYIVAWRVCTKHIRTRKNKRSMAFLSLEDQNCSFEAVLFPDCFDRFQSFMYTREPLLIEGVVKLEAEVPMVEVHHLRNCGKLSEKSMRETLALQHED
jgi:DNA polymerase III alpha subunit